MSDTTAARLATHEAVCAERYGNLMARMTRLERIVTAAAGGLIVGMASLIVTLIVQNG